MKTINHIPLNTHFSTFVFFVKMHSQSMFSFSFPSAAAKTQSFAGKDLMNFSSTPFPFPFASSALEHLNTNKKQYSDFHSKEEDDLALFVTGDGAVASRVINNDTALDEIFSLGNWIVLEDEPAPSLTLMATSFFVEPITSTSGAVDLVKVTSPEKAVLSSLSWTIPTTLPTIPYPGTTLPWHSQPWGHPSPM